MGFVHDEGNLCVAAERCFGSGNNACGVHVGGSTNAVLHLIAMARSVGIQLTLDDWQRVSDRVPFMADLRPSGKCDSGKCLD